MFPRRLGFKLARGAVNEPEPIICGAYENSAIKKQHLDNTRQRTIDLPTNQLPLLLFSLAGGMGIDHRPREGPTVRAGEPLDEGVTHARRAQALGHDVRVVPQQLLKSMYLITSGIIGCAQHACTALGYLFGS